MKLNNIQEKQKKIYLISLGCAKNLVDSENVLGMLKQIPLQVTDKMEEAEIIIINSCGFIRAAVEEAIETILEVAELKKNGLLKKIIVIGCFVQRYGFRLVKLLPEVDAWLGTGQIEKIPDIILAQEQKPAFIILGRPDYLADHTTPRLQTTPFYSAYLKIADGCSNKCTYCFIPKLTGSYRSRQIESLVLEVEHLTAKGVRELNLVAQDTTAYGQDLNDGSCLETLLERLILIEGLDWIRVLYCNPNRISKRLLNLLERELKLCPYLDIPLQHIHPQILDRMGRALTHLSPRELIKQIRSLGRSISIRTTLMVGFPGETDDIFSALLEFVAWAEFDHLGAFVYSPEKGTPAAKLKSGLDEKTIKQRFKKLMRLQAEIALKKNQSMIGRTIPVLIEGESAETDLLLRGRAAFMAPDVDSRILITEGQAKIGDIVSVQITDAYAYDLFGTIQASQMS